LYQKTVNSTISPPNLRGETLRRPFAALCLQRSEIVAGMKLQKGGHGVSDLSDTPEDVIYAVEK